MALVHYPVNNRNGERIASAVTNLDLHDLSRVARTYGVPALYVITPLVDQRRLAERVVSHWVQGVGAQYNPDRCEAMRLIRIRESMAEALDDIRGETGDDPATVVTSARRMPGTMGYGEFRGLMATGRPYLLVFGTAWGLAEDFMEEADYVLDPVTGGTEYNHLSVRSAAAIILDRLAGREEAELSPD